MEEIAKAFINEFESILPFVSLINILRAFEYYTMGNTKEAHEQLTSNLQS